VQFLFLQDRVENDETEDYSDLTRDHVVTWSDQRPEGSGQRPSSLYKRRRASLQQSSGGPQAWCAGPGEGRDVSTARAAGAGRRISLPAVIHKTQVSY